MTRTRRALVVGSGIGGATAAYTLRRVGWDVHGIDNKPVTALTGAGICLTDSTLRALGMIGLEEQCRDSGFTFHVFRQFDGNGRLLETRATPPECGMRRPELARILETAATGAGAVLELGLTVSDLVDAGNQVEVTLSDGRQQTYDLVVAADGVYSKLRDRVFGAQYRSRFANQSAWRVNAPRHPDVDGFCTYRIPGIQRFVGILPTSEETCYLFTLDNSEEPLHFPDDQLHSFVHERMAPFMGAPVVREALAQLTSPDPVSFRPFDITLVPAPWHRGRVVLMGDAAHAPTPQCTSGGGMAIEDAVVLAECLAGQADVQSGLEAYSKRRFERVKTVWNISLELSRNELALVPDAQRSANMLLDAYKYLGQPF
jgi:2-polyprenyl-6-methoxyphenol hydroxylase-like FAD-dependent oxidoreductase